MIIHITRHAQPASKGLPEGADNEYPPGDPVLSALGRDQAAMLGRRLVQAGFRGPVFSSPYRRTMETAQIIAEATRADLFPEPAIQEHVTREGTPDFEGLTKERMKELYPRVGPDVDVPYPWFAQGPETLKEVAARARPFLERLLRSGHKEALLVGHGASVHGSIRALIPSHEPRDEPGPGFNWNCALTTLAVNGQSSVRVIRSFDAIEKT